jgi:hypothetical protein
MISAYIITSTKEKRMEAMGIIGFVFGLAALAYANKSKADIIKLEQGVETLNAELKQLKLDLKADQK